MVLHSIMSSSWRSNLRSGARLYVDVGSGEYVYLGPQLCEVLYEFLQDRYGLSAYELRLRACEGNLAAMNLHQLRRKLLYSLVAFVWGK